MSQIQFRESFDSDKQSKWPKSIPRIERFLIDVVFGVAVVASYTPYLTKGRKCDLQEESFS